MQNVKMSIHTMPDLRIAGVYRANDNNMGVTMMPRLLNISIPIIAPQKMAFMLAYIVGN